MDLDGVLLITGRYNLDNGFMSDSDLIGVHPNDNTVTVWLKAKDLIKLIRKLSIINKKAAPQVMRSPLFDLSDQAWRCAAKHSLQ